MLLNGFDRLIIFATQQIYEAHYILRNESGLFATVGHSVWRYAPYVC